MHPGPGRKLSQQQQYLPSNLLQDDDLPTTTSLKHQFDQKRSISFSAPPMLFDIGYQFDDSFRDFNDFNIPEPETNIYHMTGKVYSKYGSDTYQDLYTPPINSTRKLSLQNQDYMGYQNVQVPENNYYPTMTPEEELLNNLPQVAQWSRDQNGSRAVQNVFESGEEYTKQLLFSFIFKDHQSLMKDRFGNYVFQKIFQRGTDKQKKKLFQALKGKIVLLSQHCYGCRVIQKAVQYIKNKKQLEEQFIGQISPMALRLIENQNGNHVLQKCCQILKPKSIQKIAKCIIENLNTLAFHPFGCRVIQKYLQNCKQEISEQIILQRLTQMTYQLSQCQYGNYIMQHIVLNCPLYKVNALKVFQQNFIKLSFNKYASNVIQKVIKSSELQYVQKLSQLAMDSPDLILLAKHQFGNYVIQSLLDRMSKEKRLIIKTKLKDNCQEISKSQYGRHVLMQLEKNK